MQLLHTRMGVTDITAIARMFQSELTTRLFACRGVILSFLRSGEVRPVVRSDCDQGERL